MGPHSPSVVPRGQLLEQEVGLPGIACNFGRPSSNLLYQFHHLMVPSTPCLNGTGTNTLLLLAYYDHRHKAPHVTKC